MCAQNSFKNKYMNVFVWLSSTTRCVVILLLFVCFARVLHKSKLSTELVVDDGEMNTKRSLELGELRQRTNSNFLIVRTQISRVDQDSLLVKHRNDNHSPGPVIRELDPTSHQRSELSNTILCIFSG